MSIKAKNVTKWYGAQKALDDVSFEINAGEIVGFIGPNGAGKSTMMKIITGYLAASAGSIEVGGFDVCSQTMNVKKTIGYLPENNPLYTEMYVTEYLHYVAGIYNLREKSQLRVKEMIEITGLGPEQHKKIASLSKGYRQRVGLAQALLHDPAVLILDEPTSGLDPNQIIEIRNLIKSAGEKKTVMLSTHIMQEVEAICDRVIIINKGIIVANDTASNLSSFNDNPVQTIIVEFNGNLNENELLSIKGVNKVKHLKDFQWLLQSNPGSDIRTDVFNFAVSVGMVVLSMQKQEKHLEEVFQELTRLKE
jgi:ABC-2 type transport system ATP-binding protein